MNQPDEISTKSFDDLRAEGELLRAEVVSNQEATAQTWKNMRWTVVASLIVACVSLALAVTLVGLQFQSRDRGLTIKDCVTNPASECARKNQEQLEVTVKRLVEENRRSNVVIAKCLLKAGTEAELDKCVDFGPKEGAQ